MPFRGYTDQSAAVTLNHWILPVAHSFLSFAGMAQPSRHFLLQNKKQTVRQSVCFWLCHLVEFNGKLALLVRSCILVNDAAVGSLVNLLDSFLVSLGCGGLVPVFESGFILLYDGVELRLEDTVLKRLRFDDLNALLCGFDVRQEVHLLQK